MAAEPSLKIIFPDRGVLMFALSHETSKGLVCFPQKDEPQTMFLPVKALPIEIGRCFPQDAFFFLWSTCHWLAPSV